MATRVKGPLQEIVERGQSILVLHHALLAFPQWQFWSDICGIEDRRYAVELNQNLRIDIANSQHPITKGLAAWQMVDEAYMMVNADAGSDILLTPDHPKSMKTIAWARQYHNARVFCCQSGHDNLVYANPQFRTVIGRAIQWLARRPMDGA
ncbi:MAG: ThuA domain-containing protein [Chloroflexi bacterium]|nr:ThuA domain-containing protein [Chloroflexota bacterium]